MALKRTFTFKTFGNGKVGIYEINRHYPAGKLILKVRSESGAAAWIERQVADDAFTRMSHVQEYLVERALRPAPVKIDDGQQAFNF